MAEFYESDQEYDEDVYSEEGDSDYMEGMEVEEGGIKSSASFHFDVLTPDKIQSKMFDIVDEVNTVFQLPRPVVRALLSHLKWDKDELLSRYFSDSRDALYKESHLVVPKKQLELIKPKLTVQCGASATQVHEIVCDICYCSYGKKDMTGLECGHLYCHQCWVEYLKTMILELGRSEAIYCPTVDCGIIVSEDVVLSVMKDLNIRKRYQYLITSSFVQANRSMVWCPSPGCGNAILAPDREEQGVQCLCGNEFCFGCQRKPHEPISCSFLSKWLKKFDDESETANWLHVNTKECPRCRVPIEKNGGCNHMTCRNQACRMEFCWVCLGAWDRHGSSWYNCNRFNETDSKTARNEQAKSRASLERYLHYCNRYLNHWKSSKFEHKLNAMVQEKRRELEKLDISQVETHFLQQAVDVLGKCRNTLQYTYAFAYYLIKNNQCVIFESNQGDLEIATEKLSEYLEKEISTKSEFGKLKLGTMDKLRYCDARRKALLQHVYEGYAQGIWEFTD